MVEKLNVELGADFGNFSRWHNYVEITSVCYYNDGLVGLSL